MIANFISLIFLFSTFYFFNKKNKTSFLLWFSISCIVAPSIRVESIYISLSFFYLIFPLLFFLKYKTIKFTAESSALLMTTIGISIFSLIGWLVNTSLNTNIIIPFLGLLKNTALILFIVSYFEKYFSEMKMEAMTFLIIKWIVAINFVAVIFQALTPIPAATFFYDLYWQPSQITYGYIKEFVLKYGYYSRFMGLFPSPIYLGIAMLLSWTYLLSQMVLYNKKYRLVLIMTLMTGFFSLSKTFIIGAPIMFIAVISFQLFVLKTSFLKFIRIVFIIAFSGFLLYLIVSIGSLYSNYVRYYSEFIFKPIEAIQTRYTSSDDVLLSKTYQVIKENLVFGVGFSSIKGEFVGDSSYVKQLHNGGLMALSNLLLYILFVFFMTLKRKKYTAFLVFLALVFSGAALPVILGSTVAIPFYLIILSKKSSQWKI